MFRKRTYKGSESYSPIRMRPNVRRGLYEGLTAYIIRFIKTRVIGIEFYLQRQDVEYGTSNDGCVTFLKAGTFRRTPHKDKRNG